MEARNYTPGHGVCFTDHLPEHYNRGSANINLPV